MNPRVLLPVLLAGSLATAIPTVGYFAWKAGLQQFLYCTFTFPRVYYPAFSWNQPFAYLGNWGMPALPHLGLDLLQFGPQAFCRCAPMHHEPSLSCPSTRVDKAQELEGLRLPLPPCLSILGGESPKFEQARFVRVQRQTELS